MKEIRSFKTKLELILFLLTHNIIFPHTPYTKQASPAPLLPY